MTDKKIFIAGEVLTAEDLNKALDDAAAPGVEAAEVADGKADAAQARADEAYTLAEGADGKADDLENSLQYVKDTL